MDQNPPEQTTPYQAVVAEPPPSPAAPPQIGFVPPQEAAQRGLAQEALSRPEEPKVVQDAKKIAEILGRKLEGPEYLDALGSIFTMASNAARGANEARKQST